MAPTDDRDVEPVNHPLLMLGPSLFEYNAVNPSEYVDSPGRNTHLKHQIVGLKVLQCQRRRRSAKSQQSSHNTPRVFFGGTYPEIDVFRRPCLSVRRYGIRAYDEELSLFGE
jgi:hypothetical protein